VWPRRKLLVKFKKILWTRFTAPQKLWFSANYKKSAPENFFKLSIIALIFMQNEIKLRKSGVTGLVFALLALEAP